MVPQINTAVPVLPMMSDQTIDKTSAQPFQQGGYSKLSIRHQLYYLGNL